MNQRPNKTGRGHKQRIKNKREHKISDDTYQITRVFIVVPLAVFVGPLTDSALVENRRGQKTKKHTVHGRWCNLLLS